MSPESFLAIRQGRCACRLDLASILVEGRDARDFLHAQVTANLKQLPPATATRAAWCSPQGRVLFLFWLVPAAAGYRILLPAAEATRLIQRLRLFVLRAEVTIREPAPDEAVCGIYLAARDGRAQDAPGLPAGRHAVKPLDDGLVAMQIDDSARWLLCGPAAALHRYTGAHGIPDADQDAWRCLDIAQGHAEIAGESAGAYLPQQLNLDLEGALSFDKGCYPGQEIIARLKYRGEVKARLLVGECETEVVSGERLQGPDAPTGGMVLTSVQLPDGRCTLLAVADLGARGGALTTVIAPPRTVHLRAPPAWVD